MSVPITVYPCFIKSSHNRVPIVPLLPVIKIFFGGIKNP
jgi:hypothetical protein